MSTAEKPTPVENELAIVSLRGSSRLTKLMKSERVWWLRKQRTTKRQKRELAKTRARGHRVGVQGVANLGEGFINETQTFAPVFGR